MGFLRLEVAHLPFRGRWPMRWFLPLIALAPIGIVFIAALLEAIQDVGRRASPEWRCWRCGVAPGQEHRTEHGCPPGPHHPWRR